MATIGDIISAGLKELGIKDDDGAMKRLLSSPVMEKNLDLNDVDGSFFEHLMTIDQAKTNPVVQREIHEKARKDAYGRYAEKTEESYSKLLQGAGMAEDEVRRFFDQHRDQNVRIEKVYEHLTQHAVANAGGGEGGDEKVKEWQDKARSLTDELNAFKRSSTEEREALENEWKGKLTAVQRERTLEAVVNHAKSSIKFADHPSLNAGIENKVRGMLDQYNIGKNNGSFVLMDKEDPTQVAHDPASGKALSFDKVLHGMFDESWLDKGTKSPEGGGGTREPAGGGGKAVDAKAMDVINANIAAAQKARTGQ